MLSKIRRTSCGVGFALVVSLSSLTTLLLFHSETLPTAVRSALPRVLQSPLGQHKPLQQPETYNWTTYTEFTFPSDPSTIDTATLPELCQYFPTHLLSTIQPVLKTGHSILHRLTAHLTSISSCLAPHLLVLSDHAELYNSTLPIHNVLTTIPTRLLSTLPPIQPTTTNSTTAWQFDKHKFLPSLSLASHLHPDKNWYIFYEGDTYIFWDNLFQFLAHFDPAVPWYFGSPSPGQEVDGERVWFANGGPGYVVSRAAMEVLTRGDWERGVWQGARLVERYWERVAGDCCGDSVVGWAFWENGVKVSGMWPLFNPHPPHGVPFGERYWCEPMVTMHKPMEGMMGDLWRWEFKARTLDRPLLYRDLALSYWNMTSLSTRQDWDNADFDGFDPDDSNAHESAAECGHACERHDGCFQWTFHAPDRCTFVRSFRMGQSKLPEERRSFTSGWITRRIQEWADARPCDEVRWVTPSTTRIF